jgi:hypothetical protein
MFWKCGAVQIFGNDYKKNSVAFSPTERPLIVGEVSAKVGNDYNKSKPDSGGN